MMPFFSFHKLSPEHDDQTLGLSKNYVKKYSNLLVSNENLKRFDKIYLFDYKSNSPFSYKFRYLLCYI